MDSENAPNISSVGTSFFSEARRNSSIPKRQISWFYPFTGVHGWNRLLWSCNKIEGLLVVSSLDFVQILLEIIKLASGMHVGWFHKEWRLEWRVVVLIKSGNAKVDEGLVEHYSDTFQVVASVSCYFLASLQLNHVQQVHDLVVVQLSQTFAINYDVWLLTPGHFYFIVVFILEDWNTISQNVSN